LKKISLKIVLAIVLCSSFLLVSAGTLTFRTFSEIVKSNAMEELNVILENESLNFNSETARYITGVRSIKGVVLSKLDLSKLGNDGYLESYKADLGNMMAGVAESCNLVSSYFYFIPEIDSTEQISIDDYDGNGLFDPGKASDLGEADLSSPENDWFTGALEKGFNWSTPYYWEDADSLLISYTEAVEVDGHDSEAIFNAVQNRSGDKPLLVNCKTTKGKGVSYMESVPMWHYRSPDPEEYKQAIREIDEAN